MVDRSDDPKRAVVRRFEVFTGTGRRRSWSDAQKASIILESLEPDAVVTEVARRHGVRAQQIHAWRREAREGRIELPADDARTPRLTFAPVIVAPEAPVSSPPTDEPAAPALEIEGFGVTVRVRDGADARLVAAAIHALRAGA